MTPGARISCRHRRAVITLCLANDFVHGAFARSTGKVALLLRLAFLEGQKRKLLFQQIRPARVWVFSKRLTMYRDGEVTKGSGHIPFAWFVWDHAHADVATIDWI